MRLAALLSILIACSSSSKPSTTATSTPKPTSDNTPAATGPLSEAEFKALHDAPTAGPPVRTGERITLADGSKAYLSLPKGDGPHPAVILIHEWWGLNANIEAWADRLASAGWAA